MNPSQKMKAALLVGHGGLDQLVVESDLPVPKPSAHEVLIKVGACGINNTDVNTRIGWYSKSVDSATSAAGDTDETGRVSARDAGWSASAIAFPRIQGADVAGRIAAVGRGVSRERVGERVLVDPWIRDRSEPQNRQLAGYLGSERDGGFAQYVTVPVENAFAIESPRTDAELATFPCAYSTAEYMLDRSGLREGETILIPGASGGVGSALLQLARRRKARVLAITSASKLELIRGLGADAVFDRNRNDLAQAVRTTAPGRGVDVVADVVGGDGFPLYLDLLCRGGRYVVSGAIAGPAVSLDLRTLYLKDLQMHGATVMPAGIFKKLVGYIENDEIRPLLAREFPLSEIRDAQQVFLEKKHVGNLILLPWG